MQSLQFSASTMNEKLWLFGIVVGIVVGIECARVLTASGVLKRAEEWIFAGFFTF